MKKLLILFLILMLFSCNNKDRIYYDFEIISTINDEVCIYINDLETTRCQHYHTLRITTDNRNVYVDKRYVSVAHFSPQTYYIIYVTKKEYIEIIKSLNIND